MTALLRGALIELDAMGIVVSLVGTTLTLSRLPPQDLRMRLARLGVTLTTCSPDVVTCEIPNDLDVALVMHAAQMNKSSSRSATNVTDAEAQGTLRVGRATSATSRSLGFNVSHRGQSPVVVCFERSAEPNRKAIPQATTRMILPNGARLVVREQLPQEVYEALRGGAPVLTSDVAVAQAAWRERAWPGAEWIDIGSLARLSGVAADLDAVAAEILHADVRDLRRVATSAHDPTRSLASIDAVIMFNAWWAGLDAATFVEPEVREADAKINARGFEFDSELANAVAHVEHVVSQRAQQAAAVPRHVLVSSERLKRVLNQAGYPVPDVKRETLLHLLVSSEVPDDIRRIVLGRLSTAAINGHKLRAALHGVDADDRIRHTLVYCQAATGRWAGRGFQPQNLSRGVALASAEDIERLITTALAGDIAALEGAAAYANASVHDICATLVRACIRAPENRLLAVVDYASIEARVLAWLACDTSAVESFRAGEDPYKAMASVVFDVPSRDVEGWQRELGKALVLGCGYGMSADRFEVYAGTYGVNWSEISITPREAVATWRSAHPLVAGASGLWTLMQQAAIDAFNGTPNTLPFLLWERRGDHLVCTLPSGRPLIYRDARLELRRTPWDAQELALTYDHRGQRVSTYGAKLVENVTQAVCRDLVAHLLVRLERAEFDTVLHVHDEVVVEIDHGRELEEICRLACAVPQWAHGLPLAVKGHVAPRYFKLA